MHEYRAQKSNASTSAGISTAATPEPVATTEYWEDFVLNTEYGLDDDEVIPVAPIGEQSVEEEFIAYTTSPLSTIGLDLVKYWEVGYNMIIGL